MHTQYYSDILPAASNRRFLLESLLIYEFRTIFDKKTILRNRKEKFIYNGVDVLSLIKEQYDIPVAFVAS